MSKPFNFYEPIFFEIPEHILDIKKLKKPHIWQVEIWRYHRKIDGKNSKNKKDIQKWIKNEGYDFMYEQGECMIYIRINKIQIKYWAFMQNKYYQEYEFDDD